jgi:hypothetical protein
MLKFLLYANAFLTFPFGIAALIAPGPVFAGFGLTLDAGGELISRGYAATCLGFGIICLLADKKPQAGAKALLAGSLLFNGVEFAVQLTAALQAVAAPAIWGTVVAHGVMTVLTVAGWKKAAAA